MNTCILHKSTCQGTVYIYKDSKLLASLKEHSHMPSDGFWVFLTYLPTLIHRELKLDGAIGDFAEPSEGGKLAILLHNST